jgi:hypothetical protein
VPPTLRAVQVTDVIQTLFPELKAVQGIEPIRTIFPELKAIQVNELMSLAEQYPDVVQTQLRASILDDNKKGLAICLCVIFLDPVNQLLPPSHRSEFDSASSRKGANGNDIKTERWAKPSPKVKHTHRPHFNEGHTNKKNATMNMKKSMEAHTKLNMNMNMQVNMKITIKMKMNMKIKIKIKMNVKRNMNREHENQYE